MSGDKSWYAVQTQARHENRVQRLIQQEIDEPSDFGSDDSSDSAGEIERVWVPTHEVVEIRKGKRVPVTRPLYPGYLLVKMVLTERTKHAIDAMKGVRFVTKGPGGDPQPLRPEEINRLMGIEDEDEAVAREEVPFRPGQAVEVIQGPFTEFSGTVQEVDADKGKVKVEVSLFGRPTSVELDFSQLKGF